ncbi:MAG: GYD domain-containing protein [Promethearchaeota archaeon]
MAFFIVLGNFTQEGVSKIKESPQRFEAAKKLTESLGGSIKEFYYTMGRYDFVSIIEAPSTETMMTGLMALGAAGAIRTETLEAIPLEQGAEIIKNLP